MLLDLEAPDVDLRRAHSGASGRPWQGKPGCRPLVRGRLMPLGAPGTEEPRGLVAVPLWARETAATNVMKPGDVSTPLKNFLRA
jgi:hypothetical protein